LSENIEINAKFRFYDRSIQNYCIFILLFAYKIKPVKIFLFLILVIFTNLMGFSQETDGRELFQSNNGHVIFVSDAPLELIKAESYELKGLVDPINMTFAFQVHTQTLTGFNSPLQEEHFYENYIETEKYPIASFSGKIIEKVNFRIPEKIIIRAKGYLDIHGVKKERIIKCELIIEDNKIIATSSFIVNIDEHNISIPKLVYQKIAEEIKVMVNIEMIKGNKKGE